MKSGCQPLSMRVTVSSSMVSTPKSPITAKRPSGTRGAAIARSPATLASIPTMRSSSVQPPHRRLAPIATVMVASPRIVKTGP